MRALAWLGDVSVACAVGCLVIGFGFVVPTLERGSELVDANLAKVIAQQIALPVGTILTVACVAAVLTTWRCLEHRAATTVALLAAVIASLDRFVLLPQVYEAWARVDLVAGRPAQHWQEAVQLSHWHHASLLGVGLALLFLVGLVRWTPSAKTKITSLACDPSAAAA